jgi:hypothetical protein
LFGNCDSPGTHPFQINNLLPPKLYYNILQWTLYVVYTLRWVTPDSGATSSIDLALLYAQYFRPIWCQTWQPPLKACTPIPDPGSHNSENLT